MFISRLSTVPYMCPILTPTPPPDRGVICSEKNRIASGAPPGTAEAASHPGKTLGPSPTRPRPTWGPKMSPGSIDAFGNSLGATCFEATSRPRRRGRREWHLRGPGQLVNRRGRAWGRRAGSQRRLRRIPDHASLGGRGGRSTVARPAARPAAVTRAASPALRPGLTGTRRRNAGGDLWPGGRHILEALRRRGGPDDEIVPAARAGLQQSGTQSCAIAARAHSAQLLADRAISARAVEVALRGHAGAGEHLAMERPRAERSRPCAHGEIPET